jgi:NADH-quinone oxidoreductase subunit N
MNWWVLTPEIYMLGCAALFLTLSMARPNARRDFAIALTFAAIGVAVTLATIRMQASLFQNVYRIDLFSQLFKAFLSVGYFLVVSLSSEMKGIEEKRRADFYLLLSTCTLGMMLLVSSVELLTLYISLELTSYSLYAIVPLRSAGNHQIEAGIKYFLAGIATSALMLFGLASLFGAAQTTEISKLAERLPTLLNTPMALIGFLLTLCGFFFKLALFPFHVWAPGVYQGSANEVTAFIAAVTKVTAIAVLARLVSICAGSESIAGILIALSVASMTYGNLVALVQKDFKRLLAYSAVAHAGYVLIGIVSMNPTGFAAAVFYALAYLTMTFICLLVLVRVASDGRDLAIADLAGLHRRSPLLSMALMAGIFSLGGIPPTIGFTGKFLVFTAAMERGYFPLVLIAMINVAVSLYYYIQVVRAAFVAQPEQELPPIRLSRPIAILTAGMIVVIVGGGIFPRYLFTLASAAARALR